MLAWAGVSHHRHEQKVLLTNPSLLFPPSALLHWTDFPEFPGQLTFCPVSTVGSPIEKLEGGKKGEASFYKLFVLCDQRPKKKQLKEEGIILAHSSREYSLSLRGKV